MPPPTSSLKPSTLKGAKEPNGSAPAPAKKSTPAPAAADVNGHTDDSEKKTLGKPDQVKYNAEQEEINKEIAGVKAKLVSLDHTHTRMKTDVAGCYSISDLPHTSSDFQ